jgi:uncharacterized protein YaaW (UPF0174 family)
MPYAHGETESIREKIVEQINSVRVSSKEEIAELCEAINQYVLNPDNSTKLPEKNTYHSVISELRQLLSKEGFEQVLGGDRIVEFTRKQRIGMAGSAGWQEVHSYTPPQSNQVVKWTRDQLVKMAEAEYITLATQAVIDRVNELNQLTEAALADYLTAQKARPQPSSYQQMLAQLSVSREKQYQAGGLILDTEDEDEEYYQRLNELTNADALIAEAIVELRLGPEAAQSFRADYIIRQMASRLPQPGDDPYELILQAYERNLFHHPDHHPAQLLADIDSDVDEIESVLFSSAFKALLTGNEPIPDDFNFAALIEQIKRDYLDADRNDGGFSPHP